MNNENEIKHRLLDICKVKSWDSDINLVGFHARCDELKALGADEEREACCAIVWGLCESDNVAQRTVDAIRARGNT